MQRLQPLKVLLNKAMTLVAGLSLSIVSLGQINSNGLPIVRNYTPEEYGASDQNWAAVQDHRGIMYFGNDTQGVLEYDGKTWRRIDIGRETAVRSLAVDSLGTVYVGTMGDFGYLAPDGKGNLHYKSLLENLVDSVGSFSDISSIHMINGKVLFYNRNYIFVYNGQEVRALSVNPERKFYNLYSFYCNGRLYVGSFTYGLREFIDTVMVMAPNGDFFESDNIIGMIPITDSTVAIVSTSGIFNYNQNTGNVALLENYDKFHKRVLEHRYRQYQSGTVNHNDIGIAFLFDEDLGFAQMDHTGYPKRVLSKANGLQDQTVINFYQNNSQGLLNPLWLTLDVGIARADIHTPIGRFSEESGLIGAINGILEHNGTLVVLTMTGVFYLDYDENGLAYFRQVQGINADAWSSLIFNDPVTQKERLLIGTSVDGIFEVNSNFVATSISKTSEFVGKFEHIAYSLHQSQHDPSIVYIGMSGSFAAMRWSGGKWRNLGRIQRDLLDKEYRRIVSVNSKELWLVTSVDGLVRISELNEEQNISTYGVEHGFGSLENLNALLIKDQIFVTSNNGVHSYNAQKDTFELAILPGLTQPITGKGVYNVVEFENGYILACYNPKGTERWVEYVYRGENDENVLELKPFKVLPSRWSEALYVDENSTLWAGVSTQLFSYNKRTPHSYNQPYNSYIRSVRITGDSLIFNGSYFSISNDGRYIVSNAQHPDQIPSLKYASNNIFFEVASGFYEAEDRTEYSYLLDGYDRDWSRWTTQPSPGYTNLREGTYTFKVKARNIYGVESTIATYSFTIYPPWYRTIFAYLAYVLLSGLLVWGIVVFNTRRLIAEKQRLEEIVKERTAEVVAQKEEIEGQRDMIFEQNEEIKSSINYASRIQNALLTPLETINEIFNDYFILFLPRDIVSGDFYWHTQVGNRKVCVIADCTGHGVPGGFMSMLGIGFLTQIMSKGENLKASQILDQLRDMIIESLHQTGKAGESKDGMDLALYIVDTDKGIIEFAGANNPLVIIRDNEIIQIKGDKMPIGIHIKCDTPFTNHEIEYKKGDVIYTFSDGYPDQFGGPNQRKFMIKKLKELLLEIHKKPMEEQKEILHKTLVEWEGDTDRIDDIVLMGLRL